MASHLNLTNQSASPRGPGAQTPGPLNHEVPTMLPGSMEERERGGREKERGREEREEREEGR